MVLRLPMSVQPCVLLVRPHGWSTPRNYSLFFSILSYFYFLFYFGKKKKSSVWTENLGTLNP
ncbi:hypothetical protein BDV37DRAFT_26154 [Aspergillus pseudonomiae]|uniref:Uncharacterized protein n=1 Tax=Aspergillus pseudonomiae TaxID=1506151 RepID=A0A5N7CWG7_9EURO|nr:uncharacterized protein BDV37DRAFT_26154 [Aspergillus pseudonomiae]KAE8398542.1 hypothetical protein BDV37DRAFT_26154 [Aspergillus pseudonomiae]